MARGTLLSTLVAMVRVEVGQTTTANIATQGDVAIQQMLSNKQMLLSTIRDWPFMWHRWDVSVAPGARYVSFPTSDTRGISAVINTERPFQVRTFFNRVYLDLDYGIGPEEFDIRNSDLNEAMDPVERWDFATNIGETANANQFEIWPIPVTAQTIRFDAQRQPRALVATTDTADFDDILLCYMVSAELLARFEFMAEAKAKEALVQQRLNYLTSAYPNRTSRLILGRNLHTVAAGRVVPMTIVGS